MRIVAPRSSRLRGILLLSPASCPAYLLALVLLVACSSSPLDESRSEFDQAQARWRAAAATDYDFDLQHLCYCADPATRPVTISVRGGIFHSIAYADSGTAADTTWFRDYLTIDRLFALLQRTLDGKPARFTASYHAELGYPDRVDVDPISGAADDEFSLRITKLRPPPP